MGPPLQTNIVAISHNQHKNTARVRAVPRTKAFKARNPQNRPEPGPASHPTTGLSTSRKPGNQSAQQLRRATPQKSFDSKRTIRATNNSPNAVLLAQRTEIVTPTTATTKRQAFSAPARKTLMIGILDRCLEPATRRATGQEQWAKSLAKCHRQQKANQTGNETASTSRTDAACWLHHQSHSGRQ